MIILFILNNIINFVLVVVIALISVAFLTLLERKVLASMQLRVGPSVAGYIGILQPFSDAIKLFSKEIILPTKANHFLFIAAPIIGLFLSLLPWAIIPLGYGLFVSDIEIGMLYLFAVSSMGVYPILIAGWASNSMYPFIGALRATSAMISYELVMGLILLNSVIISNSLNLTNIVLSQNKIWFFIPLFPAFLMFLVSVLAETSRAPFDLTEGESELVGGFQTEYSGMSFSYFALIEYGHQVSMASIIVIFFFGGWLSLIVSVIFYYIFAIKLLIGMFFFIWARSAVPRYRIDNLMYLNWKSLLLTSLSFIIVVLSIFVIV